MSARAATERRAVRAVTLVHNQTSGDEAVSLDAIIGLMEEAGLRVSHVPIDGAWQSAISGSTDLVAVFGGDGTVGQVLTELVGRDTPVAILPGGTANNIARTLAIGGNVATLIRGWATAPVKGLDVWEVRDGRTDQFVEAFGGGLVGSLIERGLDAEKPSLILGGALDRARHLFAEIMAAEPEADWRIEVDGVSYDGSYIGVEAMSIRSVGPHTSFAPHADPGDGLLEVILVDASMRSAMLQGIVGLATDRRVEWPRFPSIPGRMVRIVPPAGTILHIDDGLWERPSGDPEGAALTITLAGQVRYLASG